MPRATGIIRLTYHATRCSLTPHPPELTNPGDAGAPDEIVVTPAMIEAGLAAYRGGDRVEDTDEVGKAEIFTAIFCAMIYASDYRLVVKEEQKSTHSQSS